MKITPNASSIFLQSFDRTTFHFIPLKRKSTFKLVISLMAFNLIISIVILNQQSHLTYMFSNYQDQISNEAQDLNLLTTLNAYRRTSFASNKQKNEINQIVHKYFRTKSSTQFESLNQATNNNFKLDYLFSQTSFYDLFDLKVLKSKKFYEPKILINNNNSCKLPEQNGHFIILCMIHSHKNNYLRRQTMRDTWLKSLENVTLNDLIKTNKTSLSNKNVKLIHMFVLGSGVSPDEYDRIKLESEFYNDIILIDTIESYKNLVYKHLTIIDW